MMKSFVVHFLWPETLFMVGGKEGDRPGKKRKKVGRKSRKYKEQKHWCGVQGPAQTCLAGKYPFCTAMLQIAREFQGFFVASFQSAPCGKRKEIEVHLSNQLGSVGSALTIMPQSGKLQVYALRLENLNAPGSFSSSLMSLIATLLVAGDSAADLKADTGQSIALMWLRGTR